MRPVLCEKCRCETDHLTLTHNSNGYQYQYDECIKCQNRIPRAKLKIPPYFEDALRTNSFKPIEDFTKGKRKK